MTLGRACWPWLAPPSEPARARAQVQPLPGQQPISGPVAWQPGSAGWVVARSSSLTHGRVANNNGSARPVLVSVLVALGVVGGLALLGWLGIVMLDLKHLNTTGFTLP